MKKKLGNPENVSTLPIDYIDFFLSLSDTNSEAKNKSLVFQTMDNHYSNNIHMFNTIFCKFKRSVAI